MRMTGLEWRYLQKIALDHPYFDTHELPLTEKEAKAIVKANIKMTGKEFVDSIYANLGMNRPEEEKKRFAWLRSIGELFTVPPIRKIAIAVLVVILMTVFFAATPTGRAIAESVIQYIITLFDNGSLVINQSDTEALLGSIENEEEIGGEEQNGDSDIVYLESFDDFKSATGKKPIILPLPYLEVYYLNELDIDYLTLHAVYYTTDGKIVTMQTWGMKDWFDTTSAGFHLYDEDLSIYYSIEEENEIIISQIIDDSCFALNAKGHYTLDYLVEMLKNK